MKLVLEKPSMQIETELGVIDINQVEDGTYFTVEIFPPNQSKESFEDAEFNNIWDITSEDSLNMDFMQLKHTPNEWNWEQLCDMTDKAVCGLFSMLSTIQNLDEWKKSPLYEELRVIRNKYNDDYCAYCGCELDDSNRRQNEFEITVCEDCFISEQERKLEYAQKFKK